MSASTEYERQFAEWVRTAGEFEPGDLVAVSPTRGLYFVLLLEKPTRGGVRCVFYDPDPIEEALRGIFEGRIPADFLGRDGLLVWRA